MSIEEIIKMAHNYGCLYEGTLNEDYSEETLLKDLKKQCTITDVSQHRELLIAFSECVVKDVTRKGHEEVVDYFLKKHKGINCG